MRTRTTSAAPTALAFAGAFLFSLACADASAPTAPRALPRTGSLATLTAPATPTAVSATIVGADTTVSGVERLLVEVVWFDNATDLDEFVTVAHFRLADGSAVTSQPAGYAADYDVPSGSTGERTGTVVIPSSGADSVHFTTTRRFQEETLPGVLSWKNIRSEESAKVAVVDATASLTATRKGKGKR